MVPSRQTRRRDARGNSRTGKESLLFLSESGEGREDDVCPRFQRSKQGAMHLSPGASWVSMSRGVAGLALQAAGCRSIWKPLAFWAAFGYDRSASITAVQEVA